MTSDVLIWSFVPRSDAGSGWNETVQTVWFYGFPLRLPERFSRGVNGGGLNSPTVPPLNVLSVKASEHLSSRDSYPTRKEARRWPPLPDPRVYVISVYLHSRLPTTFIDLPDLLLCTTFLRCPVWSHHAVFRTVDVVFAGSRRGSKHPGVYPGSVSMSEDPGSRFNPPSASLRCGLMPRGLFSLRGWINFQPPRPEGRSRTGLLLPRSLCEPRSPPFSRM